MLQPFLLAEKPSMLLVYIYFVYFFCVKKVTRQLSRACLRSKPNHPNARWVATLEVPNTTVIVKPLEKLRNYNKQTRGRNVAFHTLREPTTRLNRFHGRNSFVDLHPTTAKPDELSRIFRARQINTGTKYEKSGLPLTLTVKFTVFFF